MRNRQEVQFIKFGLKEIDVIYMSQLVATGLQMKMEIQRAKFLGMSMDPKAKLGFNTLGSIELESMSSIYGKSEHKMTAIDTVKN